MPVFGSNEPAPRITTIPGHDTILQGRRQRFQPSPDAFSTDNGFKDSVISTLRAAYNKLDKIYTRVFTRLSSTGQVNVEMSTPKQTGITDHNFALEMRSKITGKQRDGVNNGPDKAERTITGGRDGWMINDELRNVQLTVDEAYQAQGFRTDGSKGPPLLSFRTRDGFKGAKDSTAMRQNMRDITWQAVQRRERDIDGKSVRKGSMEMGFEVKNLIDDVWSTWKKFDEKDQVEAGFKEIASRCKRAAHYDPVPDLARLREYGTL